MANVTILKIEAEDTLEIRHQVLWPDLPVESCMVAGDDEALHFGAYLEDELVGVLSLFQSERNAMRLRKFAVSSAHQGQGIGLTLLKHALAHVKENGITSVWCDARTEALGFYEKLGFQIDGEEFFKRDVSYYRMVLS